MSASFLNSVHLSGGTPSSHDLVPSIIFTIAFAALIGIWLWRIIVPATRSMALIRVGFFMTIQEGFCVTRIILAKQAPEISESLMIANIVFVLAGILLLIEPPISLWKNHVQEHIAGQGRKHWVNRVAWLMRTMLIASIALAIYTGSFISTLIDQPTSANLDEFHSIRLASFVIAIVIVASLAAVIIATHVVYHLDVWKTGYLLLVTAGLLVICVSRMVSGETTNISSPAASKAGFWILQIFVGWIICAILLSVNLRAWYPPAKDLKDKAMLAGGKDVEEGAHSDVHSGAYLVRNR